MAQVADLVTGVIGDAYVQRLTLSRRTDAQINRLTGAQLARQHQHQRMPGKARIEIGIVGADAPRRVRGRQVRRNTRTNVATDRQQRPGWVVPVMRQLHAVPGFAALRRAQQRCIRPELRIQFALDDRLFRRRIPGGQLQPADLHGRVRRVGASQACQRHQPARQPRTREPSTAHAHHLGAQSSASVCAQHLPEVHADRP